MRDKSNYKHYENVSIRPQMETLTFEAESVTYIVCEKLKLDISSYSMGYLKSWLKDVNELKVVADTVQKIAYTIISKLAVSSDTASLFEEGDVDEQ